MLDHKVESSVNNRPGGSPLITTINSDITQSIH